MHKVYLWKTNQKKTLKKSCVISKQLPNSINMNTFVKIFKFNYTLCLEAYPGSSSPKLHHALITWAYSIECATLLVFLLWKFTYKIFFNLSSPVVFPNPPPPPPPPPQPKENNKKINQKKNTKAQKQTRKHACLTKKKHQNAKTKKEANIPNM